MKRALSLATLLTGVLAATGGAAGGGPSPGLDFGNGVTLPGGAVRYLAMNAGRGTLVEAVQVRGGQVVRTRFLRGVYGIPAVDFSGTTGGLARNGRRLVLASQPNAPVTRFVVLDPRNFKIRVRFRLRGTWAFDALSPGGSLLYLIQYLGVPGGLGQNYAVRAFNLNTHRLYSGAIVDRREPDEKMTGVPFARAESRGGGWAYTLYSRPSKSPFVHALDTAHRRAFCVDLPWRKSPNWLSEVRLRVVGGRLELRRAGRTIARVDTRTFEVSRG
jgi:hypothetical protein